MSENSASFSHPLDFKTSLELDARRDFTARSAVKSRYCLLTSQRTGSTLIGRMLYSTGIAGDPLEYFNHILLEKERLRTGNPSLNANEFLANMEKRRTSPNGVFGLKTHYHQILRAFSTDSANEQVVSFLRGHQHLIWTRRRDKLRQAVSLAFARKTGHWSSEGSSRFNEVGTESPKISEEELFDALQTVCIEDLRWETLIESNNLRVLTVWYENLLSDYDYSCREILRHLDLDAEKQKVIPQPIARQYSPAKDDLYEWFREFLVGRKAVRRRVVADHFFVDSMDHAH